MSDQKDKKTPKQRAFDKIKEQVSKEFSAKIDTQAKTTVDAIRAAQTEKEKLQDLLDKMDGEKKIVDDVIELIG